MRLRADQLCAEPPFRHAFASCAHLYFMLKFLPFLLNRQPHIAFLFLQICYFATILYIFFLSLPPATACWIYAFFIRFIWYADFKQDSRVTHVADGHGPFRYRFLCMTFILWWRQMRHYLHEASMSFAHAALLARRRFHLAISRSMRHAAWRMMRLRRLYDTLRFIRLDIFHASIQQSNDAHS